MNNFLSPFFVSINKYGIFAPPPVILCIPLFSPLDFLFDHTISMFCKNIIKKEENDQNLELISELTKVLEKEDLKTNSFRKTLQIGVLKTLSKLLGKFSKITTIRWDKYKINWIKNYDLSNFIQIKLIPAKMSPEEYKNMQFDFKKLLEFFTNGME